MNLAPKNVKSIFTLRLPIELNKKISEHAASIGISKSAVIVNLLYNEFIKNESDEQRGSSIDRINIRKS